MKKEEIKVKEIGTEELENSKGKKEKFNIASGDKIKHFMDLHGYTAEKLSAKLDKEKRTYFYKIKGGTEFTMTEAWIMTKLFDCTLDDLVKDLNEMTEYEKMKFREILEAHEEALKLGEKK